MNRSFTWPKAIPQIAPLLSLLLLFLLQFPTHSADSPEAWYHAGEETMRRLRAQQPLPGPARNIILFVGDGMGVSTVTAARILEGQQRGHPGEENFLAFERLPYSGFSKTYQVNQQTPDSAATMTAMITGVKTKEKFIAVDQTATRGDHRSVTATNKLVSLLAIAEKRGLSSGVVTTARVTHATPAACYAHSPDRDWEDDHEIFTSNTNAFNAQFPDIARQLIEFPHGNGLEVALGGGRRSFLPRTVADPEYRNTKGTRRDGRNLVREWLTNQPNSAFVWNLAQFNRIDPAKTDRLLGLFERTHMQYEADRSDDPGGEPSLSEMTAKAIDILAKNPKGYFLMVEGGRIDHAHHAGNAYRALTETIEFARAVEVAFKKTTPAETLILVTADHSHTLTIGGYPTRGNDILGLVRQNNSSGEPSSNYAKDLLGVPFTTLQYANGPGHVGAALAKGTLTGGPKSYPHEPTNYLASIPLARATLTQETVTNKNYLQESAIPLQSETHAGEDVPIYAGGPGAHLVRGVLEQNVIFHIMLEALGPEPKPKQTSSRSSRSRPTRKASPQTASPSVPTWEDLTGIRLE